MLVHGIGTTSHLDYPYDADQFRDIAEAQTIRDGGWLQDPFYDDEAVWYNPLLPAVLAGASLVTREPIHTLSARAGGYINIAAPSTLYLLVLRLLRPASPLGVGHTFKFGFSTR